MKLLFRKDLIYPELSYQILNCAFKVHNTLGGGFKEKDYQAALAAEFKARKISFEQLESIALIYEGQNIRKRIFDFVVDKKIVVEIKCGIRIKYADYCQTSQYLKILNHELGLLIHFGREHVTHKRILNIQE